MILRSGPALDVLRDLVAETGATAVHWTRLYAPAAVARDTAVKSALRRDGVAAESHPGHLIHEPWAPQTKTGGPFRVFTPFWRAVGPLGSPDPLPALSRLRPPDALAGVRAAGRLGDGRRDAPRGGNRRGLCADRRSRRPGPPARVLRPMILADTPQTGIDLTCRRRRDCPRTSPSARSRPARSGPRPRGRWTPAQGGRDLPQGTCLARVRLAPALARASA